MYTILLGRAAHPRQPPTSGALCSRGCIETREPLGRANSRERIPRALGRGSEVARGAVKERLLRRAALEGIPRESGPLPRAGPYLLWAARARECIISCLPRADLFPAAEFGRDLAESAALSPGGSEISSGCRSPGSTRPSGGGKYNGGIISLRK